MGRLALAKIFFLPCSPGTNANGGMRGAFPPYCPTVLEERKRALSLRLNAPNFLPNLLTVMSAGGVSGPWRQNSREQKADAHKALATGPSFMQFGYLSNHLLRRAQASGMRPAANRNADEGNGTADCW
jgi:hypothetical protein